MLAAGIGSGTRTRNQFDFGPRPMCEKDCGGSAPGHSGWGVAELTPMRPGTLEQTEIAGRSWAHSMVGSG